MQWKLSVLGAAVLFVYAPAVAQPLPVPVLSGKYATTFNEICQAGTNYPAGAIYNQILVVDFNKDTKTVSLTGASVSGPLTAANGAPAKLTQTSVNTSFSYSDTATTITIGSDTFNALYGPLIMGMPQWIVFGGINHGGCSASAVAIRQSPLSVSVPAR